MADRSVKIRTVEEAHYRMNKDVYISKLKFKDDRALIYSSSIKDFFWNYAGLIDTENPKDLIEDIEQFYSSRERTPAVYLTPETVPKDLERKLEDKDYSCEANDAWMFFRKDKDQRETDIRFKKVENRKKASEFVELFGKIYGGAEEDEAYGELPEYYLETLKKHFEENLKSSEVKDYIAYRGEEPIGIGTVMFSDRYAGLYNIGVVPEKRGEGLGSQIVSFLVGKAEVDAEQVFLQTEKGSRNEQFFRKNGFKTEFEGKIMVKD